MSAEPVIYQHGSRILKILVGVAFLLPGLAMVGAAALGIFESSKPGAAYGAAGFGALLVVGSGWFVLSRHRIEINPETRQIRVELGILGRAVDVYSFSDYQRITVEHYQLRSGKTRLDRWQVWLRGDDSKLYLTEFSDKEQADSEADKLAALTGLDWVR